MSINQFELYEFRYIDKETKTGFYVYARDEETADKIIVMKEGRVVSEDTPDNIFYSRVLDDVFSITLEKENGRYFYLRKKDGS